MSAVPASTSFAKCDASGVRLTRSLRYTRARLRDVTRRLLLHNAVCAAAPQTATDYNYIGLQRVLNAAARLISRKYDQGLSRLMHQDLHWLDITERVSYKLCLLTHRYLLGKAPVYRRAFAVAGPMTFNALPDELRDPTVNTITFRRL